LLAQRKVIEDQRVSITFLLRRKFGAIGITKPIAQINHTLTRKKGAVRGLHFQHHRMLKSSW